MTHPIPLPALDGKVGVMGITGSGKTHTAIGLVEALLDAGRHLIIIDPTGAYNGLRTIYPLPIFGGRFGDVEIGDDSGEQVARAILDNDMSAIVDVSLLLKESHAAARRFMGPFVSTLKGAPPRARYVVMDEADEFMPEHASGDTARLFGDLKWIVRRGRIEGWRMLMVTQRPQDIAKSVLTQCDTMVIHQLTSPQDRKALLEWVKGTADETQAKDVFASMAKLETGEAWVWSPRHDLLKRVKMPANRSEDRSKTPDADDAPRAMLGFKEVDLGAVRAAMKRPVEAEARIKAAGVPAVDVAPLHATIADLKGRLASESARADEAERVLRLVGKAVRFWTEDGTALPAVLSGEGEPPPPASPAARVAAASPSPRTVNPVSANPSKVPSGCAKALATLAGLYPGGMTEGQWALAAGYKKSGGTWSEYRRRLLRESMIETRDGMWFATALGAASAGPVETPPSPGPELARWWAGKISGTPKMVEALLRQWPNWVSREFLAQLLEMEPTGGTFGEYVRRLVRNHVAVADGKLVRLSGAIMGEAE